MSDGPAVDASQNDRPSAGEGPFAPGDRLVGRFRISRRLAQGGMGIVYEAVDEKLDRRIAIKCARPGRAGHLSPEARLASEISHPNICRIFEIHSAKTPAGPVDFVTMEMLDGETLSRRLWKGPLPPAQARSIAQQLCAGLAEAHRRKVVHGDFKSPNVMLTEAPGGELRAVITDFGLAHFSDQAGGRGGTPAYAAPEVRAGQAATIASDVYSLGVVLYELATGVRPYDQAAALLSTRTGGDGAESDLTEDWQRLLFRRRSSRTSQESQWLPVLKRCLAPDPADRFRTVDEVLAAMGPSKARRRFLLAVAGLALAAVTGAVTYQRASAPAETVRLALEPFETAPALAGRAREIDRGVRTRLSALKGTARKAFSLSPNAAGTHALSGSLGQDGETLIVHTDLRDLRSNAPVGQWTGKYTPAQLQYAPVAIAGLVSARLHLPALQEHARTNAAAQKLYQEGVALTRDDAQLDQAMALLEQAARADPDSALPLAGLAEAERRKYFLTRQDEWLARARHSLEQAELRNPDCPEVHSIAGLLDTDASRREAALERFLRATEFPLKTSDPYRRLGQLYQLNGQIPEALQAYQKAIEIEPRFFRAWQDQGSLYFERSDNVRAEASFRKAVELAPAVPRLRGILAACLQNQGKFREAEEQLRIAIALPGAQPPLAELGHVLMYERRDREAIPYLHQASALDPSAYFPWIYLGLAHQRVGNRAAAQKAFRRGMQLAEEEVIRLPRSGYDRAFLAYLCAQSGLTARAESEAAQALQLSPGQVDAIWMAALTYERLGRRLEALQALEKAPRELLEDLTRWPEAGSLTADVRFRNLLARKPAHSTAE